MPHAIRRVDVAGRDVTDHLQLLLRKAGYNLSTTAEREVVRIIKEKMCYVALNPGKEEKDASGRTETFTLPDGNAVHLGPERFRAPEILFNPELIGLEYAGVHQVVVDSINRADLDLRKSLFSNIVLSGGSTLTKGFGDRLLNETKKLALKDIKIKVRPRRPGARFDPADLRAARTQVQHLDRRLDPRRSQHLPQAVGLGGDLRRGPGRDTSHGLALRVVLYITMQQRRSHAARAEHRRRTSDTRSSGTSRGWRGWDGSRRRRAAVERRWRCRGRSRS